ncbi:hypothetical protein BC829DRAFT_239690 [Chytridium lagenaria]|nr:hypothetical protein BC829DRAFT_239690 [Chytridium lagenaria]
MAVMNPNEIVCQRSGNRYRCNVRCHRCSYSRISFDLVKTRMQAFRYKHMNDCVREVYRTEGFFGFFTGVGPVVATVSVFRSITFSVYTDIKQRLGTYITSSPLTPDFLLGDRNTFRLALMSICAGTVSGSVVATPQRTRRVYKGSTAVGCPHTKSSIIVSLLSSIIHQVHHHL